MFGEKLWMNANDESFFVITAVENADVAAVGKTFHATPEIVVIKILGRRRLEGVDLTALRIDPRHDVLDGAVFAGRVHSLKDKKNRPFVLRVKHVLQFGEGSNADLESFLGPRLVLGNET